MTSPEINRDRIHLRLEENTEAALLENYLGITFKDKPLKASWTLSNKIRWSIMDAFYNGCSPFGLGLSMGKTVGILFTAGGFYEERIHTYFAAQDLFAGLHENLHAYVSEVNPDVSNHDQTIALITEALKTKDNTIKINLEKSVVEYCVNEGITTWGAIFVSEKMGENMLAQRNLLTLGGTKEQEMLPPDEKYIEEIFAKLQKRTDMLNRSISTRKLRLNEVKVSIYEQLAKYVAGYYFINKVMSDLVEQRGLTIEKALRLVLTQLPTTLHQLRCPTEYLNQLEIQ